MKATGSRYESSFKVINLPHLRSLSCYGNDPEVQKIILRIGSKSLKRFTIFSKSPTENSFNVSRFFRRNLNLRKVSLYGSFTKIHALRQLHRLSSLFIENCLDRHKSFTAICKLDNLSFLDVNIANVTSTAISNLKRLTCLRNLILRSSEDGDHFNNISLIEFPNLLTLQLKLGNVSTSEDCLTQLATNNPQLSSLEMSFSENRNVYDFIENSKQLESLSLSFSLDESLTNESFSTYFAGLYQRVENSKLTNLTLNFFAFPKKTTDDNDSTVLRILNFLPNLESLNIQGIVFSLDKDFLLNILNVWQGLEELDLDFVSCDCKTLQMELEILNQIMNLLEEFSFSLSFHLQCVTHYERTKNDIRTLGLSSDVELTVTDDDPEYFKIGLQKH